MTDIIGHHPSSKSFTPAANYIIGVDMSPKTTQASTSVQGANYQPNHYSGSRGLNHYHQKSFEAITNL